MSTDEERLTRWISAATGLPAPDSTPLSSWLRSGVVLCALANALQPGAVGRVSGQSSAFALMENTKSFLTWLREVLHMRDADLFVTVDLFEMKNWKQVVHCLMQLAVLARTAMPDYRGPLIEGEVKSAYASGAANNAGPIVAPVATAPRLSNAAPPAPRKPPPKVPTQANGAVAPLPAAAASTAPVVVQLSAAEALNLVAPHARRSSLNQGRGARGSISGASAAASDASAHAHAPSAVAAPSSSGSGSNGSSNSSDSKLWSTVQSLTSELYAQQSTIRELSLVEQHRSAALGVLQQMLRHQSEAAEVFKAEMAQLREQMGSLAHSNASATAAAQSAAAAAAASALAQARAADAAQLAKLQAEVAAASSAAHAVTAASKAQQHDIQQLQQSQAASFAAAAAASASASASAASGSAPSSSSAALDLDSIHQQLHLLRAQHAHSAAQHAETASSTSQEVAEMRAQVSALQSQLAGLTSAAAASAAAAAATPPSDPVAASALALAESTSTELRLISQEFAKTKKQNLALREALLKLHARVEGAERDQNDARQSALDARATAVAASAAVAAWAATPPTAQAASEVSSEEFSRLRKAVQSAAKQARSAEEGLEYLSAALEAAQVESARRLENVANEAVARAEEAVRARVEEISAAASASAANAATAAAAAAAASPSAAPTPAAPGEAVSAAHEERFSAIQAELHGLSESFLRAQEASEARNAAAAETVAAAAAAAATPPLDVDAVRAAVQPALDSLSSDLSSLRSSFSDLSSSLQQGPSAAAAATAAATAATEALRTQSEAVVAVQADVSWLREKIDEIREDAREAQQGSRAQSESLRARWEEWQAEHKHSGAGVQSQVAAVRAEVDSVRAGLAALSSAAAAASAAAAPAPAHPRQDEEVRPALDALREEVAQLRQQLVLRQQQHSGPAAVAAEPAVATVRSRSGSRNTGATPAAAHPPARSRGASTVQSDTAAPVSAPVAQPAQSNPVDEAIPASAAISGRASRAPSVSDTSAATMAQTDPTAAVDVEASVAPAAAEEARELAAEEEEDEVEEEDVPPPVPASVVAAVLLAASSQSVQPETDGVAVDSPSSVEPASNGAGSETAPVDAAPATEAAPAAEAAPVTAAEVAASAAPSTATTTEAAVASASPAPSPAAAAAASPAHRGHTSSDLLASRYAEEMERMRAEFESRLEGERRAKEAAESLLQQRRQSVSLSSGTGLTGGFTPSTEASNSAAGSRLHSARSSVDYGSGSGSSLSFAAYASAGGGSRKSSSASLLGLGSLAFSSGMGGAGGFEDVVHEGDEEGTDMDGADTHDSMTSATATVAEGRGRGASTSGASTNLFALDTSASGAFSADGAPSSQQQQPPHAVPASPSMAAYEAQLAAMKADFEARVAAEREITERRKRELSSQRSVSASASVSLGGSASTPHSRAVSSFSSSPAAQHQPQYTPLTIEETSEDPCAAYYAQTVAAGASEHMRSRMLPLINSSRRCLSLSEVGEAEALRLQANLAIMRETLLGRRRVIEEDEGDSDSDSDSDSDED